MLMMAPPIFEAVESVIAQYDSETNSAYSTDEICDEMSLIGNPSEVYDVVLFLWDLQVNLLHKKKLVN